jgi:hypothetical protein
MLTVEGRVAVMILPIPKSLLYWILLMLGMFLEIQTTSTGQQIVPAQSRLQHVTPEPPGDYRMDGIGCEPDPPDPGLDSPVVDFTPLVEVSTVAGIFSLLVALVWSTGLVLAARAKYRKGGT